jgi:hypothetical protein
VEIPANMRIFLAGLDFSVNTPQVNQQSFCYLPNVSLSHGSGHNGKPPFL